MLSQAVILETVDRVVRAANKPSKVILFGSYGRGDADDDSDLDLLVVEAETPDKGEEYMRLCDAIGRPGVGVGVDLLIYDEAEFEERSQVPGNVLYRARKEGRVLYDARA